jgi:hypothetical protein
VVSGGVGTILVVIVVALVFPLLRRYGSLAAPPAPDAVALEEIELEHP